MAAAGSAGAGAKAVSAGGGAGCTGAGGGADATSAGAAGAGGGVEAIGAGASVAPAVPSVRTAGVATLAFASTWSVADFPWNVANNVCLPGLTNTGSSNGAFPTTTPSMLISAPVASTMGITNPAFFFASAITF